MTEFCPLNLFEPEAQSLTIMNTLHMSQVSVLNANSFLNLGVASVYFSKPTEKSHKKTHSVVNSHLK